jgi:hypothetical protein
MHPSTFISLFPPFPWKNEVFIAICFWEEFKKRINDVICPAIIDLGMKPRIVNKSTISDSIIADICDGLTQSKLVFGDITTTSAKHRNENVLYEIGIAHATRRPEQVVLFRSDKDRLPFDVTTIRVNDYDPEKNPAEARATVKNALEAALRELDASRSLAAEWTANCIDQGGWHLLEETGRQGYFNHPASTMAAALTTRVTLNRLLELRVLQVQTRKFTKDEVMANPEATMEFRYVITPLGQAVLDLHLRRTGLEDLAKDPEIIALLKEHDAKSKGAP